MVSGQQHTPAASTPGKDPVPILQEAGWVPEPVWTGGKSHPHRDSIPDRPARSQSLYRLSYPAHYSIGSEGEISGVVKLASHLHIVPRSRMNGAKPPFTHTVLRWCLIKNNKIFSFILSAHMFSFPLLSLHRSILSYFLSFSFYSTTFLFLVLRLLYVFSFCLIPLSISRPTQLYCTSATERFKVIHWPETQECTFQNRNLWHSCNATLAVTYIGGRSNTCRAGWSRRSD